MILIPSQDKKFIQVGRSNVLGNMWSSFNLDLKSNEGRLRVSPRLLLQTNTTGDSSLTTAPAAFRLFYISNSPVYWTISGTRVHSSGAELTTDFSVDAISGSPTNCDVTKSDMEVNGGELYVSTDTNDLYYLTAGGTWASMTVGGSDTSPHPMTSYANLLYYLRSTNLIYSVSTGHAASLLLTYKDGNQQIIWKRPASNSIWFGTLNRLGGKGEICQWDGASTQVTRTYRLPSQGALCAVIKDDIPHVMDTEGAVLIPSGNTFKEIARLPINKTFLKNATSFTNNRFVHPNGGSVIDGEVCFLINNENGDNGATINENLPSGIWALDKDNNFYHKQSFSYCDDDAGSVTDYGQNRISVAGALADLKLNSTSSGANGTFMAGALYYTNASSTSAGVFIDDRNDTVQKSGYLVSTWIDSQNVQDTWQKVIATYRQFLNSNDKITLKYRTTEAAPIEITGTWSATNAFTTTTDISSYTGYEIEIVQGQGSGKTAHISSQTTFGSTYIATMDDTFTGVTNGSTFKARLQAWNKMGEITGQTEEFSELPIDKTSPRVQIKCCMIFTGQDELHRLALINEVNQLAK